MRPKDPPPATYPFTYRNLPRSGNVVNGLGEHDKSLARPVFHSTGRGGGRQRLDWAALDLLFNLLSSPGCFWQVVRTLWQRRLYAGPVARERVTADDTAMAARIKAENRIADYEDKGYLTAEQFAELRKILDDPTTPDQVRETLTLILTSVGCDPLTEIPETIDAKDQRHA